MTNRFGFLASLGALIAAVAYGIPQLLQVAGVLTPPWDLILIFAPSLALAPLFAMTMAALYESAPEQRRVFGLAALALAIMYATLVSIVYIIQLGVVIPLMLRGEEGRVALFTCCGEHQPLTAIDLLGYALMSLSTLLAAGAVSPKASAQRTWLVLNGLLAPVLVLQLVWPKLIYVGALWLITFPLAMLYTAIAFRRARS